MKIMALSFQDLVNCPDQLPCPDCAQERPRKWAVKRFAIDSIEQRQILLRVTVGVFYCHHCRRYFRSNPDFLTPRYFYSNRIIDIAVASAIEDQMPVSRISRRLARDFGVKPSDSAIWEWIHKSAERVGGPYPLPKPNQEFSDVLCVDETYSK